MPNDISTRERFRLANNPPPDPNFVPMPLEAILNGPADVRIEEKRRSGVTTSNGGGKSQRLAQASVVPARVTLASGQQSLEQGPIGIFEAGMLGAVQGVSFGFGDELTAGLRALSLKAEGDRRSLSEIFNEEVDFFRGAFELAERQHPNAFLGGMFIGGAAIPGGLAKSGLSFLGRTASQSLSKKALAGAAEGLTIGAIAGAGSKEGGFDAVGLSNRIKGAAEGAPLGLAIGAATPGVVHFGRPLAIRGIQQAQSFINRQKAASKTIANTINRINVSPGSPFAPTISFLRSFGDEPSLTGFLIGGGTEAAVQSTRSDRTSSQKTRDFGDFGGDS